MQNDLVRKGLVCAILIVLTGTSIMPMAGSLSMKKQVSTEKPLADCSIVGDSGLSLVTIKVISEMGENGWYVSDVPFVITNESDEIASIHCILNYYNPFEYTGPFNVTEDGTDIHLNWFAVDYDGNHSEVDGPFEFDLDKTKPLVPEVIKYEAFQVDGKWYVTFSVTCIDWTSGMDRVEWSLNDELQYTVTGSGPIYTWTIEWQNWSYPTFKATAYDKAGNSDYVTLTIYPPIYPPNGLESSQFSTSIIKEDSHQRSQSGVSATERVGIEKELLREKPKSDCSTEGDFDIASLVVVVNRKMGNNDWIVSDVNITFIPDPDDITAVYYKLDDGEWTLYTEPLVFSGDGFHTFWWYIVDDKGNTSTPDSIVFNIDRTPPTIKLTKEKLEINKIKFTATVDDVTSGINRVNFYLDGDLVANLSSPPYEWIYTGFRRHTVTAVVYDNVGNSNSSSMSTWSSYSNQQSSSMPSIQNVIGVVPSTGTAVMEKASLPTGQDKSFDTISSLPAYTRITNAVDSPKKLSVCRHIAYGFRVYPSDIGPCYFDLDDPGNITHLSDWGQPNFLSGGTWTNDGRWLCSLYGDGLLMEVDLEGHSWVIGGGGANLNGLAYNPVNNKLYGAGDTALYLIDPDTGAQELIGSYGGGVQYMIGIAFDSTGTLYGWDIVQDKLWTINTESGEATEIGPLGIDLQYAQDGAFDYDTDTLYLSAFTISPNFGGYLYTCDKNTGACTLVGQFDGDSEIDALAIPYNWSGPTADFNWTPNLPNPGEAILFNASASYDPNGHIILYEWDWNNDGIFEENHTSPTATHSWSDRGCYPVTLKVTDNSSLIGMETKKVRVGNQPPYEPSNPYPEDGTEYVPLNLTLSWTGGDPDSDDTVTYDVYFEKDNPTPHLVSKNQTVTFYIPGNLNQLHTYYWKIVAWDNHGASTAGPIWHFSTNITPVPPPPTIDGPQCGKVGIEYEYTFSVKDNGCNNISIYIVWGDGETNRTAFVEPGIEIKLNHTWYKKGNYLIMANAKDIYGLVGPWGTLSVTMPVNLQINQYSSNQLLLKMMQRLLLQQ
jgi:hypothetical protein